MLQWSNNFTNHSGHLVLLVCVFGQPFNQTSIVVGAEYSQVGEVFCSRINTLFFVQFHDLGGGVVELEVFSLLG